MTLRYVDVTGDGLADICGRDATGVLCQHNTGSGFAAGWRWTSAYSDAGWDDVNNNATLRYTSLNGDGALDVCMRSDDGLRCLKSNVGWSDRVYQINNGIGGYTQVVYQSAVGFTASTPINPTGSGAGIPMSGDQVLVQWVGQSPQSGTVYWQLYGYNNGRYVPGTYRTPQLLGYENTAVSDIQTGITTTTSYAQVVGPTARSVTATETKNNLNQRIGTYTTYGAPGAYYCNESGCVSGYVMGTHDLAFSLQRRASNSVMTHYDFGTALYRTTQNTPTYDGFGSVTQSTVTATSCPAGSCGSTKLSGACVKNWVITQTATPRAIGLPYRARSYVDDSCGDSYNVSDQYTYYDNQTAGVTGTRLLLTGTANWMGNASSSGWSGTSMTYDVHGNRLSETSANGLATSQTFDATYKAMVATSTDTRGRVTSYSSDARWNQPTWVVNPDGLIAASVLDVFGRVTQVHWRTDPTTTVRKTSTDYSLGSGAGASWTNVCQWYGAGLASTLCSKKYIDGLGRVYKEESPGVTGLRYRHTLYDAAGRLWKVSEPTYSSSAGTYFTVTTYDTANRVSTVATPDNQVTTTTYHDAAVSLPSGAVTSLTTADARGKKARRFMNERGLMLKTTEGLTASSSGISTSYVYNNKGQLTTTTGPTGLLTTITYNDAGQKLTIVDPDAGTSTFTYYTTPGSASFGQLNTQTRPAANAGANSTVETLTYDAYGRVATKVVAVNGVTNSSTTMTYDEAAYTYSLGRLTTASTTAAGYTTTLHYSYTIFGEKSTISQAVTGTGVNFTAAYTQVNDALGRTSQITYPDSSIYLLNYDSAGQASTVQYKPSAGSGAQTLATLSDYTVRGQIGKVTYGNGVASDSAFDSTTGRLTVKNIYKGATTFLTTGYGYDAVGHIATLVDYQNSGLTTSYSYDDLNRLTQAARQSGQTLIYAFDNAGNMTRKDSINGSGTVVTTNLTYTANTNKISNDGSNSYTHSVSGNILTKGNTTYGYSADNMLQTVTLGGTLKETNVYGHENNRVAKIYNKDANTVIKTFYLANGYEIREKWIGGVLSASQTTKYFSGPDGQRLASMTSGQSLAGYLDATRAHQFYAAADMYDAANVNGLAHKIGSLTAGMLVDPRLSTVGYGLLASMVLVLLWGLYYRRRLIAHPWVLFSLLAVLSSGKCGGDRALTTTDHTALPALSGDTTSGLPLGTYYYHGNHQGSASVVTNDTGVQQAKIIYLPYGEIDAQNSTGSDIVTHKFTGQEYDAEVGLYNYNARYYDPSIGRFTSADTETPIQSLTQGLNRYMYVLGNPVSYTDPSGHRPCGLFQCYPSYQPTTTIFHNYVGQAGLPSQSTNSTTGATVSPAQSINTRQVDFMRSWFFSEFNERVDGGYLPPGMTANFDVWEYGTPTDASSYFLTVTVDGGDSYGSIIKFILPTPGQTMEELFDYIYSWVITEYLFVPYVPNDTTVAITHGNPWGTDIGDYGFAQGVLEARQPEETNLILGACTLAYDVDWYDDITTWMLHHPDYDSGVLGEAPSSAYYGDAVWANRPPPMILENSAAYWLYQQFSSETFDAYAGNYTSMTALAYTASLATTIPTVQAPHVIFTTSDSGEVQWQFIMP